MINIFSRNKLDVSLIDSKERDTNLFQQITFTLFVKGGIVISNLVILRLLFPRLSINDFGLWATFFSIFAWISLFDLGIGYSLRNRIIKKLVKSDNHSIKIYLSSSYLYFTLLIFLIGLVAILTNTIFFKNSINDTRTLITIFLILFFVSLQIVNQLLVAVQRSSYSSLYLLVSNALFIAYIFSKSIHAVGELIFVFSLIVSCAVLLMNFVFFFSYRELTPSFGLVSFKYFKLLINDGLKFFVIQLASLVVFSFDNIIILNLLGSDKVGNYDASLRTFNLVGFFFTLLMAPLWSSFAEAYFKKDFEWIKSKILLFKKISLLSIPPLFIMVVFHKDIYRLIYDSESEMEFLPLLLFAVLTWITIWNAIFANFLNSISKLNEQLVSAVITIALKSGVLFFCFVVLQNFSISSLLYSSIISLLLFAFLAPFYSKKYLTGLHK